MKKKKIIIAPVVTALAVAGALISAQYLFPKQTKEVYTDPFVGVSKQGAEIVKDAESDETRINTVNEDYYDIEFDLAKKEAIVDGEAKKISEFLNIDEQTIDSLITDNLFASYLKYHLIGNVSEHDGKIAVSNPYSTDALIVKGGNANELRSQEGVKDVKQVAGNYYVLEYNSAAETKSGYNKLLKDRQINNVTTDLRVSISEEVDKIEKASDSDELVATTKWAASGYEAWGVESTGANHYTIKLLLAGNNQEVKVAVLDTGINATHDVFAEEETADRLDMTYSHDYVNNDNDPTDDNGHGTQVSGVVVESTPSNVKVVPVKVMDNTGHGNFSNIIVAAYEISSHVDVINMSLGLTETEENAEAIESFNEILAEISSSVTMVAASGNESASASDFPASSPSVWSIGAVDDNNVVASFSNHDDKVDFTAPGVGLKLPHHTGDSVYAIDAGGTSFASPFVAGAVALIKAEHPDYTNAQIYSVLCDNAVDLGAAGKDEYYGYGSIDFDSNMFSSPVFAAVATDNRWSTEKNHIAVGVVGDSVINHVMVTSNDNAPSSWYELNNEEDYIIFNFDVSGNGTYYAWAMDADNDIGKTEIISDHIDLTAPTVVEQISRDSASDKTLTAKASIGEQESGISSVDWTIVNNETSASRTETDTHGDASQGESGENVEISHKFLNLSPETNYTVSARVTDLMGHTLSVPATVLTTTPAGQNPITADINVTLSDVLSLALLNADDLSETVDTLDLSLVPNSIPKTTAMVVRSSGNTDHTVMIEMEGSETGLVEVSNSSHKIAGTENNNVTLANMPNDSWGFSLDATNFSKVPANGSAANIGTFTFGESYYDTTVTFGAKVTQATTSGLYTGNIVFTVVANE